MKKADWKILALVGIASGMSVGNASLQADVGGVSPTHHAHDCRNGCPGKPAPKSPNQDSRKYYNNQTNQAGPRNPDAQSKIAPAKGYSSDEDSLKA